MADRVLQTSPQAEQRLAQAIDGLFRVAVPVVARVQNAMSCAPCEAVYARASRWFWSGYAHEPQERTLSPRVPSRGRSAASRRKPRTTRSSPASLHRHCHCRRRRRAEIRADDEEAGHRSVPLLLHAVQQRAAVHESAVEERGGTSIKARLPVRRRRCLAPPCSCTPCLRCSCRPRRTGRSRGHRTGARRH